MIFRQYISLLLLLLLSVPLSGGFGGVSAASESLTVWESEPQDIQNSLDEVMQKFRASSPRLVFTRRHFNQDDLWQEFAMAHIKQAAPDLVIGTADFAATFALLGHIAPVERLIDPQLFFPQLTAGVQDENGIWGVPLLSGNQLMLFINQRLQAIVPADLEALKAQAIKGSNLTQGTFGLVFPTTDPLWFSSFLGAFDGNLFVRQKLALDSKASAETIHYIRDLIYTDKATPNHCDYICADAMFTNGLAAMIINGDWARSKYQQALGNDLIIAPLPVGPRGARMNSYITGRYILVSKSALAAKKELIQRFVQFLIEPDQQQTLAIQNNVLPVLRAYTQSLNTRLPPSLRASLMTMNLSPAPPFHPQLAKTWSAMRQEIPDAIEKNRPVSPAVAARQLQRGTRGRVAKL